MFASFRVFSLDEFTLPGSCYNHIFYEIDRKYWQLSSKRKICMYFKLKLHCKKTCFVENNNPKQRQTTQSKMVEKIRYKGYQNIRIFEIPLKIHWSRNSMNGLQFFKTLHFRPCLVDTRHIIIENLIELKWLFILFRKCETNHLMQHNDLPSTVTLYFGHVGSVWCIVQSKEDERYGEQKLFVVILYVCFGRYWMFCFPYCLFYMCIRINLCICTK